VMPVIAGLEDDGSVYLSGMDSLGAIETAKDFIVAGSAPDSLTGMCESMFRPDMVRRRPGSMVQPCACMIPVYSQAHMCR